MDIVFICYWGRVNDDVFETCVNTLSKHSKAHLQVHSDNRPDDLSRDYGIRWSILDKVLVEGRRALCKIERLGHIVRNARNGDRILVADADLYFLDDPFKAFEKEFDLAVTTRCHEYRYPINAGVFFFRVNDRTRRFIDFHIRECTNPVWPPFVEFREKVGHTKFNPDWEIGQDFLCACWENQDNFALLDLKIIDLGPEYNFCPNTDVFGVRKAQGMIQAAYEAKSVKILHLKSELKLCIYDEWMKDAVVKPGGRKKWLWM